jgi:hypothetical protein
MSANPMVNTSTDRLCRSFETTSFFSQNGGTCYLRQGTFGCSCPVGFSGVCCEINLVATNPCYNNPCVNAGTCQVAAPNLFRCVCPTGLTGLRCELRVCDPNPCLYGGVCLVVGNSFQCQCPPQYTGPTCAILIPPPNPCASQPCLNGGTCTPTSPTSKTDQFCPTSVPDKLVLRSSLRLLLYTKLLWPMLRNS